MNNMPVDEILDRDTLGTDTPLWDWSASNRSARRTSLFRRQRQQQNIDFCHHYNVVILLLTNFKRLLRFTMHIPSFAVGSLVSGAAFLIVDEQLSHRTRLSKKWAFRGTNDLLKDDDVNDMSASFSCFLSRRNGWSATKGTRWTHTIITWQYETGKSANLYGLVVAIERVYGKLVDSLFDFHAPQFQSGDQQFTKSWNKLVNAVRDSLSN